MSTYPTLPATKLRNRSYSAKCYNQRQVFIAVRSSLELAKELDINTHAHMYTNIHIYTYEIKEIEEERVTQANA